MFTAKRCIIDADTKCLSSRTRSVSHRAGDFLRSVVQWTREGACPVPRARSSFRCGHAVSFIAHTECVSSRREFSLFCSTVDAHTKCVSSRREFSPFRGAVDAGGRLFRSAGTKCLSSRTRSVFHRAGSFLRSVVQWTREGASAIPWRTGLARTRCACRSVGGSGACVSGGAEGPIGFRCFQIADSTRKRRSENLRQGACGQLWLLRCTAAISRTRSGSAQRSALQKI